MPQMCRLHSLRLIISRSAGLVTSQKAGRGGESVKLSMVRQGMLTEGGRLSLVDLLIKVACFGKKCKQYFQFKKELL